MSKTRLMTAATTAIAGLLLTGCGSASPGVAVKVGDEEISTRHVDEVTSNYCTAVGELESAVPMGFVRQYVVQLLTLRSQASQIADDYGVEPGTTYHNDVAQRQGTASTKPEEVQDDYVELASTSAYAQDILDQVGRIVLEDQGVTDPTAEQTTQAGIDVFNQWPNTQRPRDRPALRPAQRRRRAVPGRHQHLGRGRRHRQGGHVDRARPGVRRDAAGQPPLRLRP